MGSHGLYKYTAGGSNMAIVVTSACSFIGAIIDGSDACTVTIKDSAATIAVVNCSSGSSAIICPAIPIACTAGLNATGSGGANYTVFYGDK